MVGAPYSPAVLDGAAAEGGLRLHETRRRRLESRDLLLHLLLAAFEAYAGDDVVGGNLPEHPLQHAPIREQER